MNPEILTYSLALHLLGPINPSVTTEKTTLNPIIEFPVELNYEHYLGLQQVIFDKIMSKFSYDILQYPELLGQNYELATQYFTKTINALSTLAPDNIVFSLTHSDSLYFRIYKGNKEINLEVFYTKTDDEDEIEAVVNTYENEVLTISEFGRLEKIIENIIYQNSLNSTCIFALSEDE